MALRSASDAPSVLALCAGAGGFELGLKLALRSSRVVCYVEREAFPVAVLVSRMAPNGPLDQAPVWSDVRTFDPEPWRGKVDIVTAGFPCQPHSVAGKRAGTEDERWLWPDIDRIVRTVGPKMVLLENVPGICAPPRDGKRPVDIAPVGYVLGDLAEAGFHVEWDLFSAAGVGAPHIRKRIFLLGISDSESEPIRQLTEWNESNTSIDRNTVAADDGVTRNVSDADGDGLQGKRSQGLQHGKRATHGHDTHGRSRPFPPALDDKVGWQQWFAETGPQPAVRRDADGLAHRLDRLRTLGNGVVPLVVAHALCVLAARARRRISR